MATTPNPFFPWEEAYNLSYKVVDDQHREIAEIIGGLYEAVEAHEPKHALSKRLTDLVNAARAHFMTEEQIMRTNAYPDYLGHRAFHDGLLEMLMRLRQKFTRGTEELNARTVELMKLWMIEHTVHDRRWRDFLG
jgi:hemerythrin